ncbi:cell division protein FtsA [Patescibacteria group bacterium]|nr:cell division protein FtsA [Patescibacteria group bacterium]MBU4274504.1 cell division protein FtsA [Patescibacteria group bacterium]MBU4367409.1 cell division protein FtsA [Patescibacteria group bacterium]MBU4461729.1 cell division protein FtsA [Patescibacteria group bacterium]MCG2700113.1 cell division protein FtsA [Candidatus Parcubacteria bacterium]
MARTHIITGLDIGTSTIKALVVQKRGKELEVLAQSQIPSFGVRKGAVVNIDEVEKNVQALLSEVEKLSNKRISSVFINIGGSHLYITPSDGIISVSRANQKISQEDIDRVLQAVRAVNIPTNEEILNVFPKEFIINDQKGIKEPLGLTGVRLEVRALLLCVFSPYFINLTQAVLNTKVQINDIIPSPIAAASAVLTPQQKEIGVALIDIGAATTSLVVFEEGELIHFAVFPIGSSNITNDIAIGLRTEIGIAENIKKEHGSCLLAKNKKDKASQSRKKIEIFDKSSPLVFPKKLLVDIIEPRVSEIFDLINKELKKIGRQQLLPGGVVLTGGGAKLPKIKELAKQELKLPCEIGIPGRIMGLEEDPSLATVCGLVLEGSDFGEDNPSLSKGGFWAKVWAKIKKIFKNFIP